MHDTIENYFHDLIPICYLSEQSKGIVLKNSEVVKLKRRKYLFKRGDTDNKSFYLLEGEVELRSPKNTLKVHSGSDSANYPLAQFQPRQYSLYTLKDCVFLALDKGLLDSLAEKDGHYNLENPEGMVVSEEEDQESIDWMSRILVSDLFSKLPPSNIQKIFSRIEPVEVKKGDMVVRQDDVGDFFYIIERGHAQILRKPAKDKAPIKLDDLSVGDYFGEEALVSDCPRNATAIMITDGDLMRLPRSDFVELIRDPILKSYSSDDLPTIKKDALEWIDVRFPEEYLENTQSRKFDIPLHLIREQIQRLELSKKYIVCCEDGNKSAVAAFLLSLKGFDAAYLQQGLANTSELERQGINLNFLNDKDTPKKDSKVIDFIPRHASKNKTSTEKQTDELETYENTQELPTQTKLENKLAEELDAAEQELSQEIEEFRSSIKQQSSQDAKQLAEEIEKQKKEIEAQLAEQAEKKKQQIEKQLSKEVETQKREIEKLIAEEAKKEKAELEKQLAEERSKQKAVAEKQLANEAAKQKKLIEKQLAEEARKEKKEIEKQLAEERSRQKADIEKKLVEELNKQKKEVEAQLAEELRKEREEVERQLAAERAKQKAEAEKQLAQEAAKQKKLIEKQLAEEAAKQKKLLEKQLADEKAKQKAAAEKRIAEEKEKQRKLIEAQLIEERAKQKAQLEKQLAEERAKQKALVEKQMAEEAARQKQAIEDQMAREAAAKKAEVEKQLAMEAERRKKAIEAKLAEQEASQKAVIDDILMKGKTSDSNKQVTQSNDSINKLINHYRLEHEKVIEESDSAEPTDSGMSKIKSLKSTKEKQSLNLKKLKEKVMTGLKKPEDKSLEKSNEASKTPAADKQKILKKRYNILNDPRFRDHIQKLNLQKDKEVRQQISSLKKVLDLDISDSHTITEDSLPSTAIPAQQNDNDRTISSKSDKTIAQDIDIWIKQQEMLESSPRRMELIEEKQRLMKQLQKQYLEDKKIDKIRNQSLLAEIQSALGDDDESKS